MRKSLLLSLLLSLLCLITGCSAHAVVPGPALGDDISFVDLAGQGHQLLHGSEDSVRVLLFITHDCPIANSYAPTIQRLAKRFAGSVPFYLVHVDPGLDAEQARTHAREYGHESPVILDAKHDLVHATGATVTPEAVVLAGSKLVYRGRIDDLYVDFGKRRTQASTQDLADAIEAARDQQTPSTPTVPAVGCFIQSLK